MNNVVYWPDLTGPELQAWVQASHGRAVAVSVVGAIEQHGPHLSLATDTEIGQGLMKHALAELKEDIRVVVLPPIMVGTSEEHADFVGTISLEPQIFEGVLLAYGQALYRAGVHRWVVVNAHGGNVAAIESVALHLRKHFGVVVAKAYYPKFQAMDSGPDPQELKLGLHGGQLETSLMMAIAPDQVKHSNVDDFQLNNPPWAGQAQVAWLAQDLNSHGVAGQAHLASAKEGEALLKHYGKALAEVIAGLWAYPDQAHD